MSKNLTENILTLKRKKISLHSEDAATRQIPANELWPAIVHELKTPLNAISGFSSVLEDELISSNIKECSDYVREISFAANELNELIHDLLDVGQASSGDFTVDLENKIDVCEAINRSIRINHSYAIKRNIRVNLEVNQNIAPIHLDAKRIKQILTNLISNAIKYSPKQSEITISCQTIVSQPANGDESYHEYLEILVSDQGFGMTQNDIAVALQKYKTITNPNSGTTDSFGLGLPTAKHLVELQNGEMYLKSEVNKGTEIRLLFPY